MKEKISQKGAVRRAKGFTLFILNEDMNDIIKITASLEDSGVLNMYGLNLWKIKRQQFLMFLSKQ